MNSFRWQLKLSKLLRDAKVDNGGYPIAANDPTESIMMKFSFHTSFPIKFSFHTSFSPSSWSRNLRLCEISCFTLSNCRYRIIVCDFFPHSRFRATESLNFLRLGNRHEEDRKCALRWTCSPYLADFLSGHHLSTNYCSSSLWDALKSSCHLSFSLPHSLSSSPLPDIKLESVCLLIGDVDYDSLHLATCRPRKRWNVQKSC